jgi:hypothetical protein
MNASDVRPPRVRLAIALSIAAHVCALWILAVLLGEQRDLGSAASADDPIANVTTIVHREAAPPPARRHVAPRAVVNARSSSPPRAVPKPNAPRVRRSVAGPTAAARVNSATRAAPDRPAATSADAFPHVALVAVAAVVATPAPPPAPSAPPSPTPNPVVSPTPIPTVSPTPTPAPSAAGNFGGLFSQNYPPAFAAPADLAALRSQLPKHVRIRVDVDETGRATDVRFVAPQPTDETLAQAIRAALLALRYVPADCNGLHCEGTLEINY